jgi:hypothetical protein
MSFVQEQLVAGLFVVGLFIDLRKAFDCVDHKLLMSKMFKEGIRDDPMSLFRSYLEQRVQMVQINGQKSEPGVVPMGVVQGGVLVLTLFNIFVNDMFSLEVNGIIQMNADDTIIKYSASSLDKALQNDQQSYGSLTNLADNNVVRYGTGIPQRVDTIKYLGLYLDTKLGFSDHLRHI